jgi:hypothetical protein
MEKEKKPLTKSESEKDHHKGFLYASRIRLDMEITFVVHVDKEKI